MSFSIMQSWVQISALPFTSDLILKILLNFPGLKWKYRSLIGVLKIKLNNLYKTLSFCLAHNKFSNHECCWYYHYHYYSQKNTVRSNGWFLKGTQQLANSSISENISKALNSDLKLEQRQEAFYSYRPPPAGTPQSDNRTSWSEIFQTLEHCWEERHKLDKHSTHPQAWYCWSTCFLFPSSLLWFLQCQSFEC